MNVNMKDPDPPCAAGGILTRLPGVVLGVAVAGEVDSAIVVVVVGESNVVTLAGAAVNAVWRCMGISRTCAFTPIPGGIIVK